MRKHKLMRSYFKVQQNRQFRYSVFLRDNYIFICEPEQLTLRLKTQRTPSFQVKQQRITVPHIFYPRLVLSFFYVNVSPISLPHSTSTAVIIHHTSTTFFLNNSNFFLICCLITSYSLNNLVLHPAAKVINPSVTPHYFQGKH